MTDLEKMLIRHEGLRLKPYRCTSDKLTIGIGRNLDDFGISEPEALHLLYNDIDRCVDEAKQAFDFYDRLNQARQDVIVSMVFNMGMSRLLGFKKMISALRINDYDKASEEMMDSLWSKQVGRRAYELSQMMRQGEYLKKKEGKT